MNYLFAIQQSELMLKVYNKIKSKPIYSTSPNPVPPKSHWVEYLLMEFYTD